MNRLLHQISLGKWDMQYRRLRRGGLREAFYGGILSRHARDSNPRLRRLRFDPSPAALRLWNFLLTEEERLQQARDQGRKIVGAMKDLGTVPVMAYSLPKVTAFYPDGAWWLPCLMEQEEDCLVEADRIGLGASLCPVRAMAGAFLNGLHFPRPDLLVCSAGATCDDFSAIAQRVESLGFPILWWEIPYRRAPTDDEASVILPGGFRAPSCLVSLVRQQLERVRQSLQKMAGVRLDDARLAAGIRRANRVRRTLAELRHRVFTAPRCPLPALELLIAEMLAIHFCSDQREALAVLEDLLGEVRRRMTSRTGFGEPSAVRVFWVNPVADLRAMNLLEKVGGRLCGTDHLFCHALDEIPTRLPPMTALARMALADPMVGTANDRAARIVADIRRFGAEAVIVSRIPGASHCASEGLVIRETVETQLGIPVVEIEVPPVLDSMETVLRTRLEALVETVRKTAGSNRT